MPDHLEADDQVASGFPLRPTTFALSWLAGLEASEMILKGRKIQRNSTMFYVFAKKKNVKFPCSTLKIVAGNDFEFYVILSLKHGW